MQLSKYQTLDRLLQEAGRVAYHRTVEEILAQISMKATSCSRL